MSNYRGLLWSIVVIAGTATAAAVVYRYATRRSRPQDEQERRQTRTHGSRTNESGTSTLDDSQPHTTTQNTDDDEIASIQDVDDEIEEYEVLSNNEEGNAEVQQQQVMLVTREGNMLLSVFGLSLILLVVLVGLITVWTNEEPLLPTELPMFSPLMWIAIGIVTAASVELLSQNNVMTVTQVPVLTEKDVFPYNDSDFDMIQLYNDASLTANDPLPTPLTSPDDECKPEARKSSPARSPNASPRRRLSPQRMEGSPARSPVISPAQNGEEETKYDGQEEEEKEECSTESIIAQAEALFEQNQHQETYDLLKRAINNFPYDIELLWRLARACNYLVEEQTTPEAKKILAVEGLAIADTVYGVDPNSAASNKWKAIMTSTMGNFCDLKEKIAGAFVIRDHIQRAIELDPNDATSHNVLGQWCLAFADLTWIEKRAVAALVGTPPSATYDEAIVHFQAAEDISPGFWKKNAFLLAQTYYKKNDLDKARSWILKARDVVVHTLEDHEVEKEIETLMKKLKM